MSSVSAPHPDHQSDKEKGSTMKKEVELEPPPITPDTIMKQVKKLASNELSKREPPATMGDLKFNTAGTPEPHEPATTQFGGSDVTPFDEGIIDQVDDNKSTTSVINHDEVTHSPNKKVLTPSTGDKEPTTPGLTGISTILPVSMKDSTTFYTTTVKAAESGGGQCQMVTLNPTPSMALLQLKIPTTPRNLIMSLLSTA